MTLYIGDVHGKYSRYEKLIQDTRDTVQVGDMGVGFINPVNMKFWANPPHKRMYEGNHRFIRGNHDNPGVCKTHSQCIPDGTIEDGKMFIGGALSIDKALRYEGYDWWEQEELSYVELDTLISTYIQARPHTMVTHDCPQEIASSLLWESAMAKIGYPSRTRQAFQSMWSAHSPALWVFGHWHHSFDFTTNGTRFVCLAELEMRDL